MDVAVREMEQNSESGVYPGLKAVVPENVPGPVLPTLHILHVSCV